MTDCVHCLKPITTTGTAVEEGPVHIECFHAAKRKVKGWLFSLGSLVFQLAFDRAPPYYFDDTDRKRHYIWLALETIEWSHGLRVWRASFVWFSLAVGFVRRDQKQEP